MISEKAAGTGTGDMGSGNPFFSADGTKVVFGSWATDLGATDTNGQYDIYVRDITTDTTTLVSVDHTGTAAAGSGAYGPTISDDGTKIAFVGSGQGFVPGAMGGNHAYVRDLTTSVTQLVSPATGASTLAVPAARRSARTARRSCSRAGRAAMGRPTPTASMTSTCAT